MVKENREGGRPEVPAALSRETQKPVEKPLFEDLGFESEEQMQVARAKFAEISRERDRAKAERLKAELLDEFVAKAEHQEGGGNAALRLQIDQGKEFLAAIAAEPDVTKADKLRAELRVYQDKNDEKYTPESEALPADDEARRQADELAQTRIAEMETALKRGRQALLEPNAGDETESESRGRRRYEMSDMMFRGLDRPAKPVEPIAADDKTPVMRKDGKPLV